MPTPNKDEKREDFISRCISVVLDDGTAEDQKQAAAVCFSMWREAKKHMTQEIRTYVISEFGGNYPDVPLSSAVNMEELKALDDSPMFVTLPVIPEIGAISENGLLYDEALVNSIEKQINEKRPGGGFGHLKDEERATAFPIPQALWVGAKKVGQTLWAKAYIPKGAAREYVRTLKAVGGRIATSIYGPGKYEDVREGVRRLTDFTLESLDFAPPERAALGFGSYPLITAETRQEDHSLEDDMPTKEEIIAELSVKDIPAKLRDGIVQEWQKTHDDQKVVADLTKERDDALIIVKEQQGQIEKYKTVEFDANLDKIITEHIDWKVKGDEAKKKVDALKGMYRSRVVTELKDERDPAKVKVIAGTIWEEMKPLAETIRDALMGPAAFVSGRTNGTKLEDTPEARRNARARMGL